VSPTLVANPTSEHGFAIVRPSDVVAQPLTPVQLEELLGRGTHGSTWRARLADGTRVAVKRMATCGEDPVKFFERLERATQVHHQNLLEVIQAMEENGEFWVVSRLGTGVPLSTLLKLGRIRSGAAVATGMGILSGLTALHQAGLWHGAVHARNVHVDLDGTVRLGDHCLTPAPVGQSSAALRAADVRATGALICSMLRIPVEAGTTPGERQSLKVASSPLGLAAKAIAGPPRKLPAGYEAAHASLTLWEAARKMATSRRQAQARQDLAGMVVSSLDAGRPTVVGGSASEAVQRQRVQAPGTVAAAPAPAAPSGPAPAGQKPARALAPGRRQGAELATAGSAAPAVPGAQPAAVRRPSQRGSDVAQPAAAVVPAVAGVSHGSRTAPKLSTLGALLVSLVLLAVCAFVALTSTPAPRPAPPRMDVKSTILAETRTAPAVRPLPSFGDVPVTTPVPVDPGRPAPQNSAGPALPNLPPGAAGEVLSVVLDSTGCAPGTACTVRVEVALQPVPKRHSVSWSLSSIDLCTGATVQLTTSAVTAQPGWSHVVGFSTVNIPANPSQAIVAVTDAPASASSPLGKLGPGRCG
jgi:Protein tyrosine and serine/threonine kinase